MKLRGYLALTVVCLGLLASDLVQRFVISPWVKLRPGRRIPVLARWQRLMAWLVLAPMSRIGGAKIPPVRADVPTEPGQLILMNHQSLFDIPLVVRTVDRGYPRIVTRKRYSRAIPLISHMIRLYQYPVVDSTANKEELLRTLDELEAATRASDVPIVVFPEGHRSRDGSIGRFRSAGLSRILHARPWTVHVYVADGFWRAAKFRDLVGEIGRLEGTFAHGATLEWDDPEADPAPFIQEVRRVMAETLDEMRAAGSPA